MTRHTHITLLFVAACTSSCIVPTPYTEFDDQNSPPVLRSADAQPSEPYILVSGDSDTVITLSFDAAYDRDQEDELGAIWFSITNQESLTIGPTTLETNSDEAPPRPTADDPSTPEPLSDDHSVFRPLGGGRITYDVRPCTRLVDINAGRSEFILQETIGLFVVDGPIDTTNVARPVPTGDRHIAQYVWVLDYSDIAAACEQLQ